MDRLQRLGIAQRCILPVVAAVMLVGILGCSQNTKPIQEEDSPMRPITEVLDAHKDSLMALNGVEGVGQGKCDDQPCIRIYASSETQEVKELPDSIEGYAVDVEVTGTFGPRSTQ